MKKPLLWIAENEADAENCRAVKSPLINNIFKYRFKDKFYFLKRPAENNNKLWYASSLQQILLAISFVVHNELIPEGGIPIHSLVLEYKGQGVLLVGKSGSGKTTSYKKIQPPWKALSDDHAFIVKKGNKYRLHPFVTISECLETNNPIPRDLNFFVPLKMIFFLNKSEKDEVILINQSQAAYEFYNAAIALIKFYYKNFTTNPELKSFRTNIFNNACDIIKSVPSFQLNASLGGRFWEKIQERLDYDI
jgi:SynChlorMet cassette protein ScmC